MHVVCYSYYVRESKSSHACGIVAWRYFFLCWGRGIGGGGLAVTFFCTPKNVVERLLSRLPTRGAIGAGEIGTLFAKSRPVGPVSQDLAKSMKSHRLWNINWWVYDGRDNEHAGCVCMWWFFPNNILAELRFPYGNCSFRACCCCLSFSLLVFFFFAIFAIREMIELNWTVCTERRCWTFTFGKVKKAKICL